MWAPENDDFSSVLSTFQGRFNTNPRVKKLVADWNRTIVLEATNTGDKYELTVQNLEISDVRKVPSFDDEAENLIHLQAEENVLRDIFSGRYNPATALLDGAMSVFSHERDKVKLEALAMVIWRLG